MFPAKHSFCFEEFPKAVIAPFAAVAGLLVAAERCGHVTPGTVQVHSGSTHVNRGILHALKKDYSKALSDYDQAKTLDPDEPEAFLNKGLLLLRLETRDAEALRLLNLAIAY